MRENSGIKQAIVCTEVDIWHIQNLALGFGEGLSRCIESGTHNNSGDVNKVPEAEKRLGVGVTKPRGPTSKSRLTTRVWV
jgi:hypothetical protein